MILRVLIDMCKNFNFMIFKRHFTFETALFLVLSIFTLVNICLEANTELNYIEDAISSGKKRRFR